ncbi:hypothetical protein OCH239_03255 [Roseivivax halodurans JCM 10272]|uniref:Glycosyltransferase family 2 protein n=1 Tax=Roseivivax halodurans JCM 10272 TaxID=1449350 RepID=X7EEN8_9RHOB|nr:hypothetical protein [Roseivivax halodurans]ETX14325.1 hypothetical protein OCH239_03255 [Roseivivax halodurans JCM 10272]
MAQVPATPKARRAPLRALARLSPSRAMSATEVPSERAALALRAARRSLPVAEEVVFLIPLVGPAHVTDWGAVGRRLTATLESFIRQDDPRWRAVICCQERPALPDDARVTHLPFEDPAPGNDKWRKLAMLADHLGARGGPPAYAMSFDADDLLRQGSVGEMLGRQGPGFLAETGFVRDVATGNVALAAPRGPSAPLRKPFWKLCGSCAALLHDPALPQSAAFLREMWQHEHRMFPHLAALAGLPLAPLSRPSVLYELNHGENFGARRGRVSYKSRFVAKYRVTDAEMLREVIRDFP